MRRVMFSWSIPLTMSSDTGRYEWAPSLRSHLPPCGSVREAAQVILAWPLSATGFVLEMHSAVPARAGWAPLTNGELVSGNNYVLTKSMGTTNAFYRLRLTY